MHDDPAAASAALHEKVKRHRAASETDTIERLAGLDPIAYDRIRIAEAENLGCRVATLDAKVQAARPNDSAQGNGHAVELWEPVPWAYPVDGAELLGELSDLIARYVILPTCAADAIALWVMHAHAHDTAGISPILAVTSPTPECGKTTLITLLGALVPRPLPASNITAAALFRAVEQWRPALLIDEADTFMRGSDELRGVINSGHARSAAYVIRTVGDDHEPRQFRTWAPKAIASIGKLPPTLASRSVHIELRRMAPGETVAPLRGDRLGHLKPFAERAARWVRDHAAELHDLDPELPGTLRGRTADNWRHLIAIADLAGGDWPERARAAAETLSSGSGDQTAGIMLLEDLQRLYADRGAEVLSSAEIADALKDLEDRPWPEWGRAQKPITQRQIARLLEPFGIRPVKFRADGYTAGTRGYEFGTLSEHFSRYLPPFRSATTPQANGGAGFRDFRSATTSEPVADADPLKPKRGAGCGAVADRIPRREGF